MADANPLTLMIYTWPEKKFKKQTVFCICILYYINSAALHILQIHTIQYTFSRYILTEHDYTHKSN